MTKSENAWSLLVRAIRVGGAVSRVAWRSRYNRLWRFARFKWILITQSLQLLFIWWLSQRIGHSVSYTKQTWMLSIGLLMLLQFGWSGLLQGFLNGQFQLFKGSLVPLYQVSSAPPLGFVIGRVLEHVPRRIWSSLLWAWAYTSVLPHHGTVVDMLLLAIISSAVASLSFLSGLLALTLWQAYAPQGVRYGLTFGIVAQVGFLSWAVVFITEGGTITQVFQALSQSRNVLIGAVMLLGAIPGLSMILICLFRPQIINRLYSKGLHLLFEQDQSKGRAQKSIYLNLPDSIWRAILSREWIYFVRAPFTKIRLFTFAAAVVAEYWIGRASVKGVHAHIEMALLGLPLVVWLLLYAGDAIMAFPAEGATRLLYGLAGLKPHRLMMTKGIALFIPALLLLTAALLVGGVTAQFNGTRLLQLLGLGWLVLAASFSAAFSISAGYLDVDTDELGLAQNSPGSGQMGAWGFVGLLAALLPQVCVLYILAGTPGHWVSIPLLICLIAFVPIFSCWWGWYRLSRLFGGGDR